MKKNIISISFLGVFLPNVMWAQDTISVQSQQLLDEVVVNSSVPRTKMKGNSIETRIVGSALEHAGNAEDVLAKVGGMMKQGDDLVVIGRGTPVIYVNGRRLTDAGELKRLNSEQIRSVEVINNPGADYDASVTSVVKIKLVRQQGEGLSFDVNGGVRQSLVHGDTDPNGSVNLNYRYKGWDFFGCVSEWSNHNYQFSEISGGTYTKALTHEQIGSVDVVMKNRGYYTNLGTNFQINDHHSVGVMAQIFGNPYNNYKKVMDESIYRNGVFEDHIVSTDMTDVPKENGAQLSAYYNGQVGKLSVDWNLDIVHRHVGQEGHIDEQSLVDSYMFDTQATRRNDMMAMKLALSYSIGKGVLKLGTEETFVESKNSYSTSQSLLPSSNSIVKESMVALFTEYALSTKIGQWNAGARYEHIKLDYENVLNNNDGFVRKRDEIYPFVSWGHNLGDFYLSLNYSVKTRRPNYWHMRDAIQYHSRYVMEGGNPTLRNTINQMFSFKGGYKWFILGTEYLHAAHKILEWATPYNDQGTIMFMSQNFEKPVKSITFYCIANPVIGCWLPNYTAGFTKQHLTLDLVDDREVSGIRTTSFNKPMYLVYANNTFNINKGKKNPWQLEFNLQYRSGMNQDNDLLIRSIWSLEAAVQKSYMDGNLTFRLSANDLLRHMTEHSSSDFGSYLVNQTFDNQRQSVKFTVHYRFNTTKSKYKGSGAGVDATNRM